MEVLLRAKDFGGREVRETLSLRKNSGPKISIETPKVSSRQITYDSYLNIEANVSTGVKEPTGVKGKKATDEIVYLKMSIHGLRNPIDVILDLEKARKNEFAGVKRVGNKVYANDELFGLYYMEYDLETGELKYPVADPEGDGVKPEFQLSRKHTRTFDDRDINDFSIKIEARDKIDTSTSIIRPLEFLRDVPIVVFRDATGGPVFLSDVISNNYLYSSVGKLFMNQFYHVSSKLDIDINVAPAVKDDEREIKSVKVKVGSDDAFVREYTPSAELTSGVYNLQEEITIDDFLSWVNGSSSSVLKLEVIDSQDKKTESSWTFAKDDIPPTVNIVSMEIFRGDSQVQYLAPGHTIRADFSAVDENVNDSGVDTDSHKIFWGDDELKGTWDSASTYTPNYENLSTGLPRNLNIKVSDRLGNIGSANNAVSYPFFTGTPEISSVSIESNGRKKSLAVEGDIVTLIVESNHWLDEKRTTVKIAGVEATVVPGDTKYKIRASRTLDASTASGAVSYEAEVFNVLGGSVSKSDNSSVIFMEKPALRNLDIDFSGKTGDSPYYVKGDETIKLSFESSLEISPPMVNFGSKRVTALNPSSDGMKWEAGVLAREAAASGEEVSYSISNIRLKSESSVSGDGVGRTNSGIVVYIGPPSAENIEFALEKDDGSEVTDDKNYSLVAGDKLKLSLRIVGNRELPSDNPRVSFNFGTQTSGKLRPTRNASGVYTYIHTLDSTQAGSIGEIQYVIDSFEDRAGNIYSGTMYSTGKYIRKLPVPGISRVKFHKSGSPNVSSIVSGDSVRIEFETNLRSGEIMGKPSVIFRLKDTIEQEAKDAIMMGGNRWYAESEAFVSGEVSGDIEAVITVRSLQGGRSNIVQSGVNFVSVPVLSNERITFRGRAVSGTHYAKGDETIKLSFRSSLPILAPTVTFGPKRFALTANNPLSDGVKWEARVLAQRVANSGEEVLYSISDIKLRDAPSVFGSSVMSNSSGVVVYIGRPSVTNVKFTLESAAGVDVTNVEDYILLEGDKIKLSLSIVGNRKLPSEHPKVRFNFGAGARITGRLSPKLNVSGHYEYTHTLVSEDIRQTGEIGYVIEGFQDMAGNMTPRTSALTGENIIEQPDPEISNVKFHKLGDPDASSIVKGESVRIEFEMNLNSDEMMGKPSVLFRLKGISTQVVKDATIMPGATKRWYAESETFDSEEVSGTIEAVITARNLQKKEISLVRDEVSFTKSGTSGGTTPVSGTSGGTNPVSGTSGGTNPVSGTSGGTNPVSGTSGGTNPVSGTPGGTPVPKTSGKSTDSGESTGR